VLIAREEELAWAVGYGEFSAAGVEAQQPCESKVNNELMCRTWAGKIAGGGVNARATYHGAPYKAECGRGKASSARKLADKVEWFNRVSERNVNMPFTMTIVVKPQDAGSNGHERRT
jgi:hypothetical protein